MYNYVFLPVFVGGCKYMHINLVIIKYTFKNFAKRKS